MSARPWTIHEIDPAKEGFGRSWWWALCGIDVNVMQRAGKVGNGPVTCRRCLRVIRSRKGAAK